VATDDGKTKATDTAGIGAALPVAEAWFEITHAGGGVTRITEPHVHELIRANAFLVEGPERDMLVDSGLGISSLRERLQRDGLLRRPVVAIATHAHMDHVGSLHEFEQRLIHSAEADDLAAAADGDGLISSEFSPAFLEMSAGLGMPLPELLITALPQPGYDPSAYRLTSTTATGWSSPVSTDTLD